MSLKTWGQVALYLGAIVAANLIVSAHGPWITPYVAFALIGCDLTVRDALHDRWSGRALWLRMGALIAAGGLLSYLLNDDAAKVALASVVAFVAAGVTDTLVYLALRRTDRDTRVNASNIAAAAVDSVLFLWIAFGVVNGITWVQFVAKVAGGVVWLLLFKAAGRGAVLARDA
jgi:queuosine precursor transporter